MEIYEKIKISADPCSAFRHLNLFVMNPSTAAMEPSKPGIEIMDDVSKPQHNTELNMHDMENAVGYKEYLEASNIDASDKEVSSIDCVADMQELTYVAI